MGNDDDTDPFTELRDWARATERRVRRERQRGRWTVVALVLVVAAFLFAVVVPALRSWHPFGVEQSGGPAYPTATVPPGLTVVTSASAAPSDPFAGTPAATYPKGEAGISLPEARPVAGFTTAEVGAALKQVRTAMITGRLSPGMLTGHDPAPFVALVAPDDRAAVGKLFTTATFDIVATWIDPSVTLDPAEQPRVSGRVTYSSVDVKGLRTLRITTNFIWVYAFTGADHPLAAEHDEINWEFPATRNLRAGDRGMWIGDRKSYAAWVDCAAAAKGLLAPTKIGKAPDPRDSEDPDAYLRADHSLDIGDDCGKP